MLAVQTVKDHFTMVPNVVAFNEVLSAKAVRLFEALEDFTGNHRTCWPGYPKLAEKVKCSVRWLPEVIGELVKAGYLHVQYREGKTNIYTLLLRVERRERPTHATVAVEPMQSTSHEQKQPTKTNIRGGQPPLNAKKLKKEAGAMDFIRRRLAQEAAKKRG